VRKERNCGSLSLPLLLEQGQLLIQEQDREDGSRQNFGLNIGGDLSSKKKSMGYQSPDSTLDKSPHPSESKQNITDCFGWCRPARELILSKSQ
jgi:hypothetical protein